MSSKFHLPYHFVPVLKRSGDGDVAVEKLRETPRLGRHRWDDEGLSGRIVCRLTNETPMFIGAERRGGEPATVEPFELDGRPALPATSLRGLISSIAEAASNSALRVLDKGVLSFRREMTEALSAIGMIVESEEDDGTTSLRLRPVSPPFLPPAQAPAASRLPKEYWQMFGDRPAHLRVYVGNRASIRDPEGFSFRTHRRDLGVKGQKYYGLQLEPRKFEQSRVEGRILHHDETQHRRHARGGEMILAQTPLKMELPRPWEDIPEPERKLYTRGILRVLGCWGREDIPGNKKHELFLPYPGPPSDNADEWPTFEIPEETLRRFYDLADQRTEAEEERRGEEPLPYEPKETRRNKSGSTNDRHFQLKDGDLVYFRPSDDGRTVAEISLSAIWRGRVETPHGERATAHDFFAAVDSELVPFQPGRKVVTPAEQLFGFVASEKADSGEAGKGVQALAGRLRFSAGHITAETSEDPYLPEVVLKILANPKPPSPALYFRPKKKGSGAKAVAKRDLRSQKHEPQGRKLYLHHRASGHTAPWETADETDLAQMKSRVAPLRSKRSFLFHIDFDNLSREELGLLCYSLRPTDDFRHKLGLGKPLGLGTVEIELLGIFYIRRRQRYTAEGFFTSRYHERWSADGGLGAELAELYPAEVACEAEQAAVELSFPELRREYRDTMHPEIREPLERLGETILTDVSNPVVEGQAPGSEGETFKWFVANDKGSGKKDKPDYNPPVHQALEPLDDWIKASHPGIPTLDIHPWKEE